MKIVMVAPFSVYPKSTVPIRMLPIAKNLAERGNEVNIIVPPYDNISESGREYEIDGIDIINAEFVDLPLIKYPLMLFSMIQKIVKYSPNVVYIFKPKGYSGLVAMVLILFKRLGLYKKTKILLDTDDWEGYGGFADFFKQHSAYPNIMLTFFDFQERLIPKQVDGITVASKTLVSKLLSEGILAEKLFYVPNGKPERNFDVLDNEVVALRKSLKLEGTPVILLYTRFFEYKLNKVVDILDYVIQKVPSAKLLVLGKGEFGEENELKQLITDKGLGDSVIFGGWINFNDIPKYLAIGDVAIYPFDDTPLNRAKCPGKLIELMAAQRAIVANNVGQIKEYIEDGKSGLLADVRDNMQFASLVAKILKDHNLQSELEINSKERILTSFSWSKLTNSVELAIAGRHKEGPIEKTRRIWANRSAKNYNFK